MLKIDTNKTYHRIIEGLPLSKPEAKQREYALATETFVSQDQLVLKANGWEGQNVTELPALYGHGYKPEGSLPVGVWTALRTVEREFRGVINYDDDINPQAVIIRKLADRGRNSAV